MSDESFSFMSFTSLMPRVDCHNGWWMCTSCIFSYLHDPDEIVVIAQSSKGIAFEGGVDRVLHLVYPWPIYSELNDHLVRNSVFVMKFTSYWRCAAVQACYTGPRGRIGCAKRLRAAPWRAWRTSRRTSRPEWVLRTPSTDSCNSSGTENVVVSPEWVMTRRESALSTPRQAHLRTTIYFDGIPIAIERSRVKRSLTR